VQDHYVKEIIQSSRNKINFEQAIKFLKLWFNEANLSQNFNSFKGYNNKTDWNNNELIAQWLESQLNNSKNIEPESYISTKLNEIKYESVLTHFKSIIEAHPDIALQSIDHFVDSISEEKLKQLIEILTNKLSKKKNINDSDKND
jgi:hypothetical protein